ncbi:asparagine synthase-related protein [Actinophytocola oryzae]|uniref:asparagine synthase (glutamine-hydrolyzing) n=1 Tax=Actinophytocola oryzae TaxID=502181 RepID=A0A4R7VJQ3_9PSEU|nr:asparagine synthase-related protein [Actinophytocola oryzae]TDV49672.1 asparagine synthase (glutamine-hydrolysing) [Actinophytocola oryzae]
MRILFFPDGAAGAAPAGKRGTRSITHPSGRPWIVGEWADEDIMVVDAGTRRLVLLGRARLDAGAAERALARAASPQELDAVAATVRGAAHLAVSFDGRTRLRGTLSTACQIFHTTVASTTVAATDPGLLTVFTGAKLDEEALTLRLIVPRAPWPLCLSTVWAGIEPVPVGHWLELTADGGARTVRWWRPPTPDVPAAVAAEAVRAEVLDAVEVRGRGQRLLSADLSGGMDSTSLCFAAAHTGMNLLTHHWKPLDEANDDTRWAEYATSRLPSARHRSVAPTAGPRRYSARPDAEYTDDAEGPLTWSSNRDRTEYLAKAVAAEGSAVHLLGVGGDELFGALPAYLHSRLRAHPLRSIPIIRRARNVNRWGLRSTLLALADNTPFGRSLRASADQLGDPPAHYSEAPFGWHGGARVPHWVTTSARDSARAAIVAAADSAPLAPERVIHQALEFVVLNGGALRELNAAVRATGVRFEAPLMDDPVIEAALSVRLAERGGRGLYKPVLAAAMRGIVPDELLGRRTKGEFSAEIYDGLRHNRDELVALCDDLRLAELGLVDADALRTALLNLGPTTQAVSPLENTLACERWLRSPSATPEPAFAAGGTP